MLKCHHLGWLNGEDKRLCDTKPSKFGPGLTKPIHVFSIIWSKVEVGWMMESTMF